MQRHSMPCLQKHDVMADHLRKNCNKEERFAHGNLYAHEADSS